jgi:predicted permease
MSGDNRSSLITVEGENTSQRLQASWNRVSPRYFETIGTPIVRGRAFDERDRPDSPLVAVASQAFARKYFGGNDPIGRRIGFANSKGEGAREMQIVGVVGDAKYQDGRVPPYVTFFLPFLQQDTGARERAAKAGVGIDRSHYPGAIEIHAAGAAQGIEAEVRHALAEVDRRITVRRVTTIREQIAGAFSLDRLIARLTVAFGSIALLLACLGLYGVTAFSVSRRTREIGIRMAVGASRSRVLRTILRGALLQLVAGLVIGVPAALAAGRMLQAQLFGVSPGDPAVIAGASIGLAMAAILASLLPARRAASLDPVKALRVE